LPLLCEPWYNDDGGTGRRRRSTVIYIAAAVIALDFITKRLVTRLMLEGQTIPLIRGLFSLTFVRNPGAAFSLFPNKTVFLITMALILSTVIIVFGRRLTGGDRLLGIALSLVLGGAIGNLIDRITTGLVIDFFELPSFPVFNIADIAITSGAGLFVLGTLLAMKREGR
jgi:signal peptidase II